MNQQSHIESPLLNRQQAANYLRVSESTFDKLRKQNGIPTCQVSTNRVMFHKDDLDAYLNQCREIRTGDDQEGGTK